MKPAFPFDDGEPDDPAFVPLDTEAYRKAFGEAVRDLRERVRGLSLHRVERLSGVCRHHWRNVESGLQAPTLHTELQLCRALRIHPERLHAVARRWLRSKLPPELPALLLAWLPVL